MESGPRPLGVPFGGEVGEERVWRFVVAVERGQPDVVGILALQDRQEAWHSRLDIGQRGAMRPMLESDAVETVAVFRGAPDEEGVVASWRLPAEDHWKGRIVGDLHAGAASHVVRIPEVGADGGIALPDSRWMRVPVVREEKPVADARPDVGRDERAAHARIVGHDEGLRANPPLFRKPPFRERGAFDFGRGEKVRVVAGARDAHVHAAAGHVVGDDAAGGCLAAVHRVVFPEPDALHDVAVGGGVVVGAGVGVDEPRGLLDALHRPVPLDIGGIVEADVGVGRLEDVDRPLPRRRRSGRQRRLRHKLEALRAIGGATRDQTASVTGDKRMSLQMH